MILTRGPDDVCLGDWFLIGEESAHRFPHLTAVEQAAPALLSAGEPVPLRSLFVHWSLLTDTERNLCFGRERP